MKRTINHQNVGSIKNSSVENINNNSGVNINRSNINHFTNNIWSLILSAFSIIVSCVAFGIALPRSNELNFDYYSVIITVLSLLIAILIGWNIFSAINIKNDVDRLHEEINVSKDFFTHKTDELEKSFDSKIKDAIEKIDRIRIESKKESITTLAMLEDSLASFCLFDLENVKSAVLHTLKCMLTYDYIGEWDKSNKCVESLLYIFNNTPNEHIKADEKDIEKWLSMIKKITNREAIKDYDIIYSKLLAMRDEKRTSPN